MTTTRTNRRAVAGTCTTCGNRTIHGELRTGEIVHVDNTNITAAQELRAWAAGIRTYRASWKGAMQLDQRTKRDIKIAPAGYTGSRIYQTHQCPGGPQ